MLITSKLFPSRRILRNLQILVVENDSDSTDLYKLLLESHGAKVKAMSSIKSALEILSWYIPDILICEMRFLGESVTPLIQQIKHVALKQNRKIPILGISTYALASLNQNTDVEIEAYLTKPIDIDDFIDQALNLASLLRKNYLRSIQILGMLRGDKPYLLRLERSEAISRNRTLNFADF